MDNARLKRAAIRIGSFVLVIALSFGALLYMNEPITFVSLPLAILTVAAILGIGMWLGALAILLIAICVIVLINFLRWLSGEDIEFDEIFDLSK